MVSEALDRARERARANREQVEALAARLLATEVIEEAELVRILGPKVTVRAVEPDAPLDAMGRGAPEVSRGCHGVDATPIRALTGRTVWLGSAASDDRQSERQAPLQPRRDATDWRSRDGAADRDAPARPSGPPPRTPTRSPSSGPSSRPPAAAWTSSRAASRRS